MVRYLPKGIIGTVRSPVDTLRRDTCRKGHGRITKTSLKTLCRGGTPIKEDLGTTTKDH